MVTISDVAKKAGVSIGTVSNVTNKRGNVKKSTEEAILKAIEELGYIPNSMAQGLKTKQSNIIGVMVEDINTFFSPVIIDGICEYAEQHNYTINLCNLRIDRKINSVSSDELEKLVYSELFQDSIQKSINMLLTSRICGLIYVGEYPHDMTGVMPKLDIPIVYTYAYTNDHDAYTVNYNDFQGAFEAVDYIISCGHERIGVISGSINTVPTYQRLQGYQKALMDHGISYRPEYICTTNWNYEDAYEKCNQLLNMKEPPTTIFVMSDLMSYAVINALKDRGINVPEQISVHGFDDIEFSRYSSPKLSTVKLPLHEMGSKSCEIITELAEHRIVEKQHVLLECSHVKRDSIYKINRKDE